MKRSKDDGDLVACFKGCLYFNAGRLYRSIERMAFDVFKPLGLAPTQAFLLMAIHQTGGAGVTPSVLSETLNLDRSTVTRLMDGLINNQLIKVLRHGRSRNIYLTPKGKDLIPSIRGAWKDLYRLYSRELGESRALSINAAIARNLTSETPRRRITS